MVSPYTSAAVRAALGTVLVIVWVTWYDGPPWAWALLVGYIAFTFGVAYVIQRKMERTIQRRSEDAE